MCPNNHSETCPIENIKIRLKILKWQFHTSSRNSYIPMGKLFDYDCKLITKHHEKSNSILEFAFMQYISASMLCIDLNEFKYGMTPLNALFSSNIFHNRKWFSCDWVRNARLFVTFSGWLFGHTAVSCVISMYIYSLKTGIPIGFPYNSYSSFNL